MTCAAVALTLHSKDQVTDAAADDATFYVLIVECHIEIVIDILNLPGWLLVVCR